jgi:hypothetical protein
MNFAPTTCKNLNKFFSENPAGAACSHVYIYNPAFEQASLVKNKVTKLNRHVKPIVPDCVVDASQIAWRTSLNKEHNIWFSYPKTKNLDSDFYRKLYNQIGRIPFSGFFGQYKGEHAGQLSYLFPRRKEIWSGTLGIDTPDIQKFTLPADIVKLALNYRYNNRKEALRICEIGLKIYPRNPLLSETHKGLKS